ncbi:MAG: NHL repeat-containing protein, partial [bacterium]
TITFNTDENADCKWSLTDQAYGSMTGDCTGDGTTNQSCVTSGLVEGAEIVYTACRDTAGNADTVATNEHIDYTVDVTPPSQSNWSPAKGTTITTTSPTITFNTDENADCKWSLTDQTYAAMTNDCTGDGTTNQSCATSGLVEGAEIVYIACRDTAGNADTAATNEHVNYTVDTTPPSQSNWSPAKGTTITTTSPTITFNTDENADCKWSLTDQTYAAMTNDCTGDGTTNQSCAVSGLSEGALIVYTACRDTVGNADTVATNEHINYTVDTTPPEQSNWSPAKGSTITTTSPTITFNTNENADCRWSLTDQSYAAMAGNCTGDGTMNQTCAVSGLPEGAVIVYTACRDTAGNADTAATNEAINYTVDNTPPDQSNWNPAKGSVITTTTPTITFDTNENGDCKWSLTDQTYAAMGGDCTGDGTMSHTCAVSGLSEGAVIVYTACRDMDGNADTVASNEHINYTVDRSPPDQSNWSPAKGSVITTTSPTVTFNTNENADCKWSLTDQAYSAMAGDCTGDGTMSHTCAVSGLSEGAMIVYTACRDTVGNEDSAITNEHIDYTVDRTPPDQSNWDPAKGSVITTTSPTVTFNTNENGDCKWSLTDQAYAAMTGDCTGDGTMSHTCAVSGLSEGAVIVYTACRDTVGNADTVATNEHINYTVDRSPPDQSNWDPAKGSVITTTSPTVTFNTNESGDCKWSLTDQAYSAMAGDCTGDGTMSHTCAVSGLSDGAVIVYTACRDTAGNADTVATNEHIDYTVDRTPPDQSNWSPAKGSVIATTSPTITFNTNESGDCKWSLTDQAYSAMAGDCTGDGTMSHICAVSGLSEGVMIVYTACRDTVGNADTAATNEHIDYTVDLTPPDQSNWDPAKGSFLTTTSQTVTFNTNENADCKWSLTDLAYSAMTNDCTGDGTMSQTCAVSGLPEGAAVIVYTACRDTVGNADTAATNEHINYTVDTDIANKIPNPPVLTAADGIQKIYLSWSAPSTYEDGVPISDPGDIAYNIYRTDVAGATPTFFISVASGTTSYIDTAVTTWTTYYYEVTAVVNRESDRSNRESAQATEPGSYQVKTICGTYAGGYLPPSHPSRFNHPKDAAVEPGVTPYVYVADADNHRIKKMKLDCTYVTHWGGLGTSTGTFRAPLSVAYYNGEVYVVDTSSYIQVFDTVGNFRRRWVSSYSTSIEVVSGNVYIAAYDGKIYRYDTNGTLLDTFDTVESPRGIGVDSSGYMYVTDGADSTVKKLDPSGNVVAVYGSYGTGLGEFNLPYDVDIEPLYGYIYVADGYKNNRVQFLRSDGSFLDYIPKTSPSYGSLKNPSGLAIAESGELIVTDTDSNRVLIFEPSP